MNEKTPNCASCSGDRLTGYIDGMLDGSAMREVASHIASCETCRTELRRLEATKSLLFSLNQTAPTLPDSFWADTFRSARLARQPNVSAGHRIFDVLRRGGLLIGTASAAIILMLALFSNSPGLPPNVRVPAQVADQIDVTSLVSAHANYVAGKRLIDGSNNRIIRSDVASQTTGDPTIIPADLVTSEPLADATSY